MINNKLLNHLAAKHPTQLQTLWENHTTAGKEYAEWLEQEKAYANITPRLDVRNLTDALTADHWQLMGIENGDFIAVSRYVKADAEIEIHVHRDKGDLYGVFRKINETRTEVLIAELTQSSKPGFDDAEYLLNDIVKELQPQIDSNENPYVIDKDILVSIQKTLKIVVSWLRNKQE